VREKKFLRKRGFDSKVSGVYEEKVGCSNGKKGEGKKRTPEKELSAEQRSSFCVARKQF